MMEPGSFGTPAFQRRRWAAALVGHDERMRVFCSRLLTRLDGMRMPFQVRSGALSLMHARQRYVTGLDPWSPIESPFLDGTAFELEHASGRALDHRQAILLAEVGFDVARLAQVPVLWGGFAGTTRPGMWRLYQGVEPDDWRVDDRTYGVRKRGKLDYRFE